MIKIKKDINVFGVKIKKGCKIIKRNANSFIINFKHGGITSQIPVLAEGYGKTVDEFLDQIRLINGDLSPRQYADHLVISHLRNIEPKDKIEDFLLAVNNALISYDTAKYMESQEEGYNNYLEETGMVLRGKLKIDRVCISNWYKENKKHFPELFPKKK
jgi:hypothetical protein